MYISRNIEGFFNSNKCQLSNERCSLSLGNKFEYSLCIESLEKLKPRNSKLKFCKISFIFGIVKNGNYHKTTNLLI